MPQVFAASAVESADVEKHTLAEWASRAGGWLSPYASIRAQVDMDRGFSLKRSQFDVLYPLQEQKDRLIFMQTSLNNNDEHLQMHVGLGVRYSSNNYLLGGNTFLDYDLS